MVAATEDLLYSRTIMYPDYTVVNPILELMARCTAVRMVRSMLVRMAARMARSIPVRMAARMEAHMESRVARTIL